MRRCPSAPRRGRVAAPTRRRSPTWTSTSRRRQAGGARRALRRGACEGHARRRAARTVAGGDPTRTGIVHRLDRDTSGLMVVARSEEAQRAAHRARARARASSARTSRSSADGRAPAGRVEAPIGRDRDDPTRVSLDTDTPREAITPLRGRAALARARAAAGEARDGAHAPDPRPSRGDRPARRRRRGLRRDRPGARRQFLHATRLAFTHPSRRSRVEARSELRPTWPAYLANTRVATIRPFVPPTRWTHRGGRWQACVHLLSAAAAGLTVTQTAEGACRPVVSMKELLEAGVHFGHQTRRWNPRMNDSSSPSAAASTSSTSRRRRSCSTRPATLARTIAERGGWILFVGTRAAGSGRRFR